MTEEGPKPQVGAEGTNELREYLAGRIALADTRGFRELRRHLMGPQSAFTFVHPGAGTHVWHISDLRIKQQTGTETVYDVEITRELLPHEQTPMRLTTFLSIPRRG